MKSNGSHCHPIIPVGLLNYCCGVFLKIGNEDRIHLMRCDREVAPAEELNPVSTFTTVKIHDTNFSQN